MQTLPTAGTRICNVSDGETFIFSHVDASIYTGDLAAAAGPLHIRPRISLRRFAVRLFATQRTEPRHPGLAAHPRPHPYLRPFSPPGAVVMKPGLAGLLLRHSVAKEA